MSSVKTFNQHDFSGYSLDTLILSLAYLKDEANLPAPLRIVHDALRRAYEAKLEESGPKKPVPVNARENHGAILRRLAAKND